MPRHFPLSVSDNPRPKGPLRSLTVAWRNEGTTPPVALLPMPDRVPPSHSWLQVAAAITIILLLAIIGTGPWGRG